MRFLRGEWRRYRRVIPGPERPLAVVVDEPEDMGEVEVRDLGEGGLELQTLTGNPSWLGASMRLRLTLPEGGVVPLRARVRHVEANRVGLVFEELTAVDRQRIRHYVDRVAGESWWTRMRKLLQP